MSHAADFAKSLKTIASVNNHIEDTAKGIDQQHDHKIGLLAERGDWKSVEGSLLKVMEAGKLNPSPAMFETHGVSLHMQRQYTKQIMIVEATIQDLHNTMKALQARLAHLEEHGEETTLKTYETGKAPNVTTLPVNK